MLEILLCIAAAVSFSLLIAWLIGACVRAGYGGLDDEEEFSLRQQWSDDK